MMKEDDFINEFLTVTWPSSYGDRRMYLGSILDMRRYIGHDYVYFHSIMSPVSGEGCGSKAMAMIVSLADKHNVRLEGHVHPFGTPPPLDEAGLLKWYSKYGFEKLRYEHPENSEPTDMAWRIVRNPLVGGD